MTGANVRIIGAAGDQTSLWGAYSGAIGYQISIGTTASSKYSFGQGRGHALGADYTAAFGEFCITSAQYAFARGLYASAYHYGGFTCSSGRFSATGDNQTTQITPWRVVSTTSGTDLRLDGSGQTITLPNNSACWLEGTIIAKKVGTTTVNAYTAQILVVTDNTPTSTIVWDAINPIVNTVSSAVVTVTASANLLKITVTDSAERLQLERRQPLRQNRRDWINDELRHLHQAASAAAWT